MNIYFRKKNKTACNAAMPANLKRGNEAFASAREVYSECADVLKSGAPLSSYAFSSASHVIRSILEDFKAYGFISAYDNDAIFNFLSARQPVILALAKLKDLMQANAEQQKWDFFEQYAYTEFDDYAVICGAMPVEDDLFDFCALPIPKDFLAPNLEKSCAMSYLLQYRNVACVLEPRKSEADCRNAMEKFTKASRHPAFENVDEIRM